MGFAKLCPLPLSHATNLPFSEVSPMNALLDLCRRGDPSANTKSQRSDRIKREVCAKLASSPHFALKDIACEYQHGILQLLGEVSSNDLKELAQEHARRVDGVTHVINSIHVIDKTNRVMKTPK